jgi:CubicO group peptidase (beta-lactamase class C family)
MLDAQLERSMTTFTLRAGLIASLLVPSAVGPVAVLTAQRPAAPAGAAIPTATRDSLRSRFKSLMDAGGVASLAWAVSKGGRIIWEEGIGSADLERKIPATAGTRYSMASISKPITATGIMRLVELGKLDLDRPANEYLGEAKITGLAGDASGATVRRLLTHTAGLPLHYRFFYEGSPVKRPTMDEAITRYGVTVYPPGKVYNYSNLGYGVLDELIAVASGQSYEDFMRQEVFGPLGLPTATIGTGSGLDNAALRYDAARKPIAPYDFDHRGASAVYISAHDLVRFGMFHLKNHLKDQRPILSDERIDAMQRVQTPGDTTTGYGLGWSISYEQGYRVVSHTGGMPGVSTTLKLFPEEDVAIAVLANGGAAAPHRAVFHLAGAVLPHYDARLQERGAGGQGPPSFGVPPSLWGEWTGTVRTYDGKTTPFVLLIKSDDVHVRLGAGNALWTMLNGPSWRNNLLGGRFMGTIPSDEARRFPHNIGLSLWLDDGKLRGWAAAMTTDEPVTGAMSSYAELTKVANR